MSPAAAGCQTHSPTTHSGTTPLVNPTACPSHVRSTVFSATSGQEKLKNRVLAQEKKELQKENKENEKELEKLRKKFRQYRHNHPSDPHTVKFNTVSKKASCVNHESHKYLHITNLNSKPRLLFFLRHPQISRRPGKQTWMTRTLPFQLQGWG